MMTASMLVNSIKGIIDVWNNADMTEGEKALSIFSSLAMVLPMVTMLFND
jgi:hypothetical protein